MSYEQAKDLLIKYKNGQCTDAENALVEKWLFQYNNNKVDLSDERIDEIGHEILQNLPKPSGKINTLLFKQIGTAAAILFFLGAGFYFLSNQNPKPTAADVSFKTTIVSGSNKAILTLANGKKIILNDAQNGKLANEGNAVINKAADGELVYNTDAGAANITNVSYNTVSTPRGGQYHLILADGTNVWLNAASSIKYPALFSGDERMVEVTGEVYFEVTHDQSKPFRVRLKNQVVEDLGTHFNINAYDDEPAVKTTLLQGSVKVVKNNSVAILKPGEQALTSSDGNNNTINVLKDIETDEAVAWKNGLFQFNRSNIDLVMRQVARWYDVDILYNGKIPQETFTGNISRNGNIEQLLEILAYTGVHFKIEGRKIIVTPKQI